MPAMSKAELAEAKAKVEQMFRESGGVITAEMEAYNDMLESQLGTPAAPGIDPIVAEMAKTPKSTQMDDYRAMEDQPCNKKHIPGYSGYVNREMRIKSEGGQWSPTKPVGELNTTAPEAASPPAGSPPRSVVFSRDGVYVEGGPRRGGGRVNH